MDNPTFEPDDDENHSAEKIKSSSKNSNKNVLYGSKFNRTKSTPNLYSQNGATDSTTNGPGPLSKDHSSSCLSSSSQPSCIHYLQKVLHQISIEPVIIFHMMSLLMTALVLNDLLLDRACRINLSYNSTVCNALATRNVSSYTAEETSTQQLISSITTWRFAIEYSVPIFLVLLLGSWSDIYGRKFPLLFPMFGSIFKNLGLILCLYFTNWNAEICVLFVLIPTSLSGSYPLFSMAFHSVIVDSTNSKGKYRTIRFGIANACNTVGQAVGTALAGHLFSKTNVGFIGLFGIAAVLELVAIVLTMVLVENRVVAIDASSESKSEIEGGSGNGGRGTRVRADYDGKDLDQPTISNSSKPGTKDAMKSILNLGHLIESLKTTLKPRPSHGHLKLWLLMLILYCSSAPYYGESSVIYLFLRLKLGWGANEYGFFAMYQLISGGIGVIISMGILSYWFSLEDCIIGIFGCISQISSCLVYTFATKTTIYIAPLIDILNGAMPVAARSMITKTVEKNEQGKILSFLAGLDAINPVITSIAYTSLYTNTLYYLPGAFFLLSAGMAGPPFIVFLYFSCKLFMGHRKNNKNVLEVSEVS